VIDADLLFMGEGPLDEPVVLHVDRGELTGIEGAARGRLVSMLERCADDRMTNIAEVSVAFNPAGTVCSVPMETESSRGSAHIALGNSIAYGGRVAAVAHLDCVMRDAALELDGAVVMAVRSRIRALRPELAYDISARHSATLADDGPLPGRSHNRGLPQTL